MATFLVRVTALPSADVAVTTSCQLPADSSSGESNVPSVPTLTEVGPTVGPLSTGEAAGSAGAPGTCAAAGPAPAGATAATAGAAAACVALAALLGGGGGGGRAPGRGRAAGGGGGAAFPKLGALGR